MKRIIYYLGTLLFVLSCKGGTNNVSTTSERQLITVATGTFTSAESYTANVEGRQDIKIFPEISGRITKVCVKEGQTVRKGQSLFIIDQIPYESALKVAQANEKVAQAELETARLDLESKQYLYEQNVVSEYDLSLARNAYAKAQAVVEQSTAQRVKASNEYHFTLVESPANGVVGNLPYREGSLVSSSMQTPLTTVCDNSEMFVYFSISEQTLRKLKTQYGNSDEYISHMPSVQFRFSDGTLYNQNGRVESVSGVLNPSTGTVSVRAIFPNPDKILLSGCIGTVILPNENDNAIIIPQEATFEIQGKYFVQKVVDGKALTTEITFRPTGDGRNLIIIDGLTEGDTIVGAGAGLVKNGDQIN